MLTKPTKVNVMGTEIRVEFRKEAEDPKLKGLSGYYDCTENLIVVKIFEPDAYALGNLEVLQKGCLRHEIIHAFLFESGVEACSNPPDAWATNEEMVDWFAIQSPKIFKAFQEVGAF